MKTYIYTLSHPETGEIRYVGKTTNLKRRAYQHLDYYNKENVKFCIYINSNELYMPIPLTIKTNRYFLQDEIKEFVLNKLKKELKEVDVKLKNITCEQ